MPQAPPRNVFVYGTLRRGGRNDINRLLPPPRFLGMGQVRGNLYQIDWYPGLALGGENAVEVVGEVYEISPELELLLDEIEEIKATPESEYLKRIVCVAVDGHAVECLVYEINPQHVGGREPIGRGDWILFHAE